MTVALIIIIVLLVGVIVFLATKVNSLSSAGTETQKSLEETLRSLDDHLERRLNDVKEHVTTRVSENMRFSQNSTKEVNDRLTTASKVIGDLRERITAFEEGSKKITDLGKSIGDLTNVFKAQKMRGGWGEESLESLLLEFMPRDVLEFQYKYRSGDVIVDAIVKFNDSFLPIDSKFPLENFIRLNEATTDEEKTTIKKALKKDISKHVDDIARKYISKEDKSLDVAFMYIPAENIYYETVIRDDEDLNIKRYCFDKHVVPVSPSTLYAYIQIVLLGMKGMQVSKKAREILDSIKTMESEFGRVLDSYSVIGNHLTHAQQKYAETDKYLSKFGTKLQGTLAITDIDQEQGMLPEK
ncbi:DNA recombination protein RmuC [bacterium]|nr:DNA recombination protein RmuC [bacterium]